MWYNNYSKKNKYKMNGEVKMVDLKLSEELINYGSIVVDLEREENGSFRRLRVIQYQGKSYLHEMVNGEVVELLEIPKEEPQVKPRHGKAMRVPHKH